MEIKLECLSNVKDEIQPLLQKHWELVALNQGKIKLNPDWKEYARLDAAGVLRIFTARRDGQLIGYFVLLVSRSIHYQDHIFATNDVLFVLPEQRFGSTGYRLVKFVENWCAENNVSLMMVNTKVHVPFDRLMLGMSFNLIERVYSKYLGK